MWEENGVNTVAIRACCSCGAGLLEHANFCRWCGVAQDNIAALATSASLKGKGKYACRPISAPFLKAMAVSMSSDTAVVCPTGQCGKTILSVVLSIPILIMVIILSPLDAYAVAKAILSQSY